MGVDPDDFTERLVTKLLSRLVQGLSGDPLPLGDDAGRIVAFGDLPDRPVLELGAVLLSAHRLPMKDEESYPRWVSVLWAGGGGQLIEKTGKGNLIKRLAMTLTGVLLCSFSVGMFNLAALGVDPFQCLAQGSHLLVQASLPYGTYYLGLSLVMLVGIGIWDKTYIGIATFINMFFTGYIIEYSYGFLGMVFPNLDLVGRGLMLAAAVIIMCFGSALYYTADLGVSVYDAISLKLAKMNLTLFGRSLEFRWIRVFNDLVCVTIGTLLGKAPGVGTLITAFFMGPLISVFNRWVAEPFLLGPPKATEGPSFR
jgi:uncharacterized membrane protein YczE